ncbi:MAG: putative bifunctional diguanylate cyclase/phosphodiesterase, partial [Nitrospiria bacterium]
RLISINGNRYSLKIMQDVTEQQEARAFQRLSDAVFDIATEGIVITDARANVITVNPAFTAITGYTAKEIFGKNPRILQSGRHDKKFYKTMWDAIHQQGYWSGEIWNRRKNGEIYPEWLSITAIKDEMGNLIQYTGLFSDITRQKKDEHELLFQAHHDALTGLPNRTLCIERLAQAVKLSRRNHKKTALLFIDLNGFKQVNDTYGHLSGDKALQEIARRLLSIVRLTDTVTRPGGDEFIIILTDLSDSQEAVTLARKIIKEISKPVQLNGQHSYLGASIGISIAPDDATAPLSIIQKADMAMYKAKGLGPNHIQFFSDELGKLAAKNALMEWDLKRAIKQIDIEFTLHYQPVFDLNTRQMSSCEALIRWHHPEKGVILPDAFIPVSEKSGLTSKISPWVLSTACTKLKEWHDRFGLNLAGSVNLSSKDLSHADPLPWIIDALEKSGLPPHLLIVEITERTMINPQDAEILRKLKKISDFGIRISVDDFGTGYSSLSYLAKYPIDILKIDKSFTLNIASDPEKQPIVEAITQMGKKLKMEIIAEGVETRRDCAYLTDIGCDKAQGYYFDQPCSGKDFEKKLEVSQVET